MRAGADLTSLLRSESEHGPARKRRAMSQLLDGVANGEGLAESMSRHYFPPLLISMTRVGEATGRLERTLLMLASHYEHQVAVRRTFLTSIAWPALQLVMAIAALSLLIWILGVLSPPTGGEMADILGFGLRGASGVLWFWFYLATVIAAIAGVILAFRNNVAGVQNIVPLLYRIPAVGSAIQTITLSRFAWTLSLALDAGLDPIRAVRLALDSTGSDYYRSGSKDAEAAIRNGATLTESLKKTDLFPDDFLTQVEVGELSGTDAESIDAVARDYDERAKMATKTIGGIASAAIWVSVILVMLLLIARLLSNVMGMYSRALNG